MKDQVLRNKSNQVIGKIKEINGKLEIRNPSNQLLGRFDPKTNQTRDKSNRLIGKGNLLTTLL